jgi:fumarate hydratase class II
MPGKVNPVVPEAVLQVAAQVIGNDATITVCGQAGNFELNAMMPVLAHNLLESINLLAAAAAVFAEKCVQGISANREACAAFIERSLALSTGLVPRIGYDRAAAVARNAYESGRTIRQVLTAEAILPKEEIDRLLDI